MAEEVGQRAPAKLGRHGRALWRRMTAELVFEPAELAVLEHAARLEDAAAALAAYVDETGLTARGSTGQERLNPAVIELRQTRLSVAKLLGQLELPAADSNVIQNAAHRRAVRAAEARWGPQPKRPKGKGA